KGKIHKYSFTGGIAELIYKMRDNHEFQDDLNPYNDIGAYLALEIKKLVEELDLPLIEPDAKIRATVIGAGAYSLSISGSTCYWDESIKLPLNNIPIVPINVDYNKFFFDGYLDYMKNEIEHALINFNLVEGEDRFALYFKDHINRPAIGSFARSIEYALPNTVANNKLLLITLGEDGGKVLGLTIKRETSIKTNLICLDELDLESGDWIDIGYPLNTGVKKAFPITKKSLVFYNK
ncbi:MAG: ethanolamine ammonia-lyase reactivating factor EutA, partial [Promethearchaeota archaeon]